jgi:hypothetical protein
MCVSISRLKAMRSIPLDQKEEVIRQYIRDQEKYELTAKAEFLTKFKHLL